MCTSFVIGDAAGRIVGKNMDVFYDEGYLFSNQRNLAKTAFVLPPGKPAVWVSQYGSLTFHQSGKEFPVGGMNETGLVVEQMTLWETEYSMDDGRPAISELQWIQYMLDTCRTVREVIEAASRIRIGQGTPPLHYLVCDRQGDTAVIEFVEGNLAAYTGEELPVPVLSNSTYKQSLEYADQPAILEENTLDEYKQNSLERFIGAARLIQSRKAGAPVSANEAFELLQAVKRPDTVWSIVYDIANLEVHFFTNREKERKKIQLRHFDFSDGKTAKALPVHCRAAENIQAHVVDYERQFNKELAQSFFTNETFAQVFKWNITEEMIDFYAGYPEQFVKRNDIQVR